MKSIKILFIILVSIFLNSCDSGDPLPTSGENSFVATLNGERFVAENRINFSNGGTRYGLQVYVRENSWELSVSNTSGKTIYFYIHNVFEPNLYLIEEGERNIIGPNPAETPTSVVIRNGSLDLLFISDSQIENEYIRITRVQGDSILIGEFEKITLIDPENPNNKAILREGKFNINIATLNKD
ncbi:hypothetical protein ACKGJN_11075 [Gillisia sp. Q332]|uniref:hypothetical protein n=1 Tax=Gillisia xinjiangensis TaxID=3384765 RepID=UPI00391A4712